MTVEEIRREVVRSRVLKDGDALAAHVLLAGSSCLFVGQTSRFSRGGLDVHGAAVGCKRLLFRGQSFNFAKSSETQPLIWSILRSISLIAACSSLIHPSTSDR